MSLNILVVDDAQLSREAIARCLNESGHHAEAHANPFTALEALENGRWELVVTDLRMPSMDGLQFMKEIKARSPDTAVIIMTGYGQVETAVQAIRDGALDYLSKPFHMDELGMHIRRLEELLKARSEVAQLRRSLGLAAEHGGLVGASPEMQKVFQQIAQFASRTANVLITGETGTGKEMVARALHEASSRKNGPFVAVACGAIPKQLAESEFFGHEAGAFTGALKRRLGQWEVAQGGTLFLDDVDDLPPVIQPKLLRAIQEHEFRRVGGEQVLRAEPWLLSSTKRDLAALAAEGRFREDLLYRLQVLTIHLPPLRERKGDILLLANHFLELQCQKANEAPKTLCEEAQAKLLSHRWPGNVRELRHAIEYAVAVCAGPVIHPEDLQLRPSSVGWPARPFALHTEGRDQLDLRALQAELEREAIHWALRKAQGDQGKAAELLKMPRTTFLYRLRQLGLTSDTSPPPGTDGAP